MARAWMLQPLVLVMVASGCFAGSAAPQPPQPYAVFHIRGTYTSRPSHFGGERRWHRFTLTCRSPHAYPERFGDPSWQERLCLAIMDYRTRTPTGTMCACRSVSVVRVDVRGTIRGRPVRERFTPCLCGDSSRAAADARVILSTHPPFRTAALR